VGQRTPLSQGVPRARNTNKHGSAGWIPHGHTVLIWAHVEHGHIDPGRLLDDLQ
jgi:hypothetical protein